MALRKMYLNINGAERLVVCDPEVDTLSDVIRRIGLTGTKVGCNTGQCGACNVILDGKLVRSCVKKMKNIKEYSTITTVEGIGQPNALHALQQAFIFCGAVQCGFCIPGFIVSSKALLDQNINPTRQEVRDWFTKNRNGCRCTGYKQIVDAVILAAAVLRGEKTMDDITYQPPEDGRVYGTSNPRPAAYSKVTGLCDYGDDIGLKMPKGTLHLAVVLSKVSHGNIKGIDFSEAETMPGVVKVITAKDMPGYNRIFFPATHSNSITNGMERPIICDQKVFRYGDIVAVVAADNEVNARLAAQKVKVDIEELPKYLNYLEAVVPGAMPLHDHQNQYLTVSAIKGEETREVLSQSKHVVEGSFHSIPQPHLTIEPDCGQAYIDEDGCVTVHSKSLMIHYAQGMGAPSLGLAPDKFRVIENPTGASFGYTMSPAMTILLGACTMALGGTPVTLTLSYSEHMLFSGKRLASYSNARLGCDEEGKITAMEFHVGADAGAYTELGEPGQKSVNWGGFGYNIPNIRGISRVANSNNSHGTAYRGSGSVQAYTWSEAIVDMLAKKAGFDSFDFRYMNLAKPGETGINQQPYRQYVFKDLMDAIKPYYDTAKKRCETESTDTKKRGVGITNCGFMVSVGNEDACQIDLELNSENGITCYNAWQDQGQGGDIGTINITHEAFKDTLKLDYTKIKLVMSDTKLVPPTGPSGANRQHFMVGNATKDAADQLLKAMQKPDGTYRTYEEMKAEGIETRYRGTYVTKIHTTDFDWDTGIGEMWPEYNYCSLMAEVEVDTTTGKTTVLSMVLVYDIGTIGNQAVVDGQAYGALMHGVGMALSEQYIDDGNYDSLVKSGFTYANGMPDDITLISLPSERKNSAYGGVGCCELFQSTPHVTVLNAINDAVGVRIYEGPAAPEKVKAGLEAKKEGKEIKPHYYVGPDFYESLEEIYTKVAQKKETITAN